MLNLPKVKPFEYAGENLFEKDKQELLDLIAYLLTEKSGFRFEYEK